MSPERKENTMRINTLLLAALAIFVSADVQAAEQGAWRLKSPGYNCETIELPKECKEKDPNLNRQALLYSPIKKPEGKIPLVVFLHGAGGTKKDNIEAFKGNRDVRWFFSPENKKFVARVLVLHAKSHWMPAALDMVVDHLLKTYDDLDKDRIYCVGYSLGGLGTWNWARHSHARLAAIIAVGWKVNLDDAEKMIKLPIWAMVGTGDRSRSGTANEVKKKFVDQLGSKVVRITNIEGANHGQSAAKAWKQPGLLEWLFSHSLKKRK